MWDDWEAIAAAQAKADQEAMARQEARQRQREGPQLPESADEPIAAPEPSVAAQDEPPPQSPRRTISQGGQSYTAAEYEQVRDRWRKRPADIDLIGGLRAYAAQILRQIEEREPWKDRHDESS